MSEVQSIIFDKKKWSVNSARAWLINNNFPSPKLDIQANFLRFRQKNPKKYRKFATKDMGKGIKFILGFL